MEFKENDKESPKKRTLASEYRSMEQDRQTYLTKAKEAARYTIPSLLKDNNNGEIYNVDSVLSQKGRVDYITGDLYLEFNAPVIADIIIDYTHNATNIATYKNLNTQTFYFDPSSLEKDDLQDSI